MQPELDRDNIAFDAESYLKRLKDLENPLPLSSPWFLPYRPDNSPPEEKQKKGAVKLPTPLSKEEKSKLRSEYLESVKLPATKTFDTFPDNCLTEVLPGKAWVVPNLLTEEECEQIIEGGERWGVKQDSKMVEGEPMKATRTSKRTNNWINEELSVKMVQKLPEELLVAVEGTVPYTSVRAVHPNWRVARYQNGETFPAHMDQADSVTVEHPEKKRQRFTSSHTLLIYLRRRGEQFQGGATRLFIDGETDYLSFFTESILILNYRNLQWFNCGCVPPPGLGFGVPAEGTPARWPACGIFCYKKIA